MSDPAPRRRPRRHDGSSNTETVVFDATEQLMAEMPFSEITVARILERAGISRANFYHYFASKFDVLAALTAKILTDAYSVAAPWQAPAGQDRARSLDASLRETLDAWATHGSVMCAAIEWMHEVPEVEAAWSQMRERFVAAIAEQIRHESPQDPAPEVTATVLVCGLERSFYVSHRGLDARLPSPDVTVEPLVRITHDAIYGEHPQRTPSSATRSDPPSAVPLPAEQAQPDLASTGQAILDGLNDLLLQMPIQEISVARILEQAGASRATFYFYFASKDDAFLALYQQLATGITGTFATILANHDSSVDALKAVIEGWLMLDERMAAVFRNAVHEWPRQPALAEAYLADHARMVGGFAAALRDDRAGGTAPDGPPADAYAATLLWTVERSIAGWLVAEEHLADPEQVVHVLSGLIASAFYLASA